jgi:hypothetical protein
MPFSAPNTKRTGVAKRCVNAVVASAKRNRGRLRRLRARSSVDFTWGALSVSSGSATPGQIASQQSILRHLVAAAGNSVAQLGHLMRRTTQADHLRSASYRHPGKLRLEFADGHKGEWLLNRFDIETSYLRLPTIQAADDGTALEVEMRHGEVVQIDAGSIRAAIDPDYAKRVREAIIAMRGPIQEI